MLDIKTNTNQIILNKCNSKENFTYVLNKNKNYRYIVSVNNIYKGVNPSLENNLLTKIRKCIDSNFCSIGGWYDSETNIYYLDANIHFESLHYALMAAKNNKQIAIFDNKENKVIYLNNKKQ